MVEIAKLDIGMPPRGMPRRDAALDIRASHLADAQAKWDRLSVSDYAKISSIDELIAAVEAHYSLSHEEAKADVELWLRDVGHRLGPIG
jgi:hypothetical protein